MHRVLIVSVFTKSCRKEKMLTLCWSLPTALWHSKSKCTSTQRTQIPIFMFLPVMRKWHSWGYLSYIFARIHWSLICLSSKIRPEFSDRAVPLPATILVTEASPFATCEFMSLAKWKSTSTVSKLVMPTSLMYITEDVGCLVATCPSTANLTWIYIWFKISRICYMQFCQLFLFWDMYYTVVCTIGLCPCQKCHVFFENV